MEKLQSRSSRLGFGINGSDLRSQDSCAGQMSAANVVTDPSLCKPTCWTRSSFTALTDGPKSTCSTRP